jgi:cytochrome c556
MRKIILAVSALALVASSALADPIDARQALMKANGKAAKELAAIAKGEQPFDAAVVLAALNKLNEDAQKLDPAKHFPPGSEKGGDTTASPKIWTDKAGFQAQVDKFKADAAAAAASPPTDVAGVKATLGTIGKDCASCHEAFRVKKG